MSNKMALDALTEDQWLELAERHVFNNWDCDAFLGSVKALCADFAAIAALPRVLQIEKELTCEVDLSSNVEPKVSVSVVSPAISHAAANGREQFNPETNASKSCNQSGGHSEPLKFNCYTCAHRRELAGDAHSSCNALGAQGMPVAMLFMAGKTEFKAVDVHIRGNTHGVRSGWFMWPLNFDPAWLEICNLYQPKQA